MKTRATVLGVLASIGVLAVGWEVGTSASTANTSAAGTTATTTTSDGTSSTSTDLSTTNGSSGSSSSSSSGSTSTGSSGSSKNGTFTGSVESTRFGDVQVSVTISGGKITDVAALKLTDHEPRSVQISNYAAPLLKAEVLQAQSSKVSSISGATYTSDAYLSSLQSALDQAGF